jgi:hypothetical protein
MEKERRKRFVVMLNWLAEKYPRDGAPRVLTTSEQADYYNALKDVHIARLEWSAKWGFGHWEFFPKPCNLREAAEKAPALLIPVRPEPTLLPETITPDKEAVERIRKIIMGLKSKVSTGP